tara:strand:- start:912 stop:2645 length:1734 start_codon:yes stop_codon:yes gene_type:complete
VNNLVFKKISILSKAEKAAISLSLSPEVNLLTGENDVGKSTLVKSMYHCLGADTPQLNNTTWKKARAIYCANVEISGEEFFIVRDERYFGVFDKNRKLISRHVSIAGENGIAQFINRELKFNIELERQSDSKLGIAGPAFYFLPYYVDQDEGWSSTWTSFTGLRQFSRYRTLMIDYHLGVRPQSYYDARKRELLLKEQLASIETDRVSMQAARDSVQKRKQRIQVDVDPSVFRQEMEQAVDKFNEVYEKQQAVLAKLKDVRNHRNTIDSELEVLRRAIAEMEADYRFAESPDTPEVVGCPTCGTEFTNSFVERFGILDDIDHCHALVDQRLKKRGEVTEKIQEIETSYSRVSAELADFQAILARTKENVTLSEMIASEGMKEMLGSLNEDINTMIQQEQEILDKITANAEGLKIDAKRKKEILEFYHARMKEFLNSLNVSVLTEDDYKTLDKQIKNNALGSDLPRSLLAQYFAFLHTINVFNDSTLCPMIIDSPFQQEQDPTNAKAILDFVLSKRLEDQQMILATISIDEFSDDPVLENVKTHRFEDKLSILKKDQYQAVLNDIGDLHAEALASGDK